MPSDEPPVSQPGVLSRRALSVLGVAGLATAATAAPSHAAEKKRTATANTMTSVAALRTTAGASNGDQVLLLGYFADNPGLGAGVLYWDADATEADDNGMVFAVAGTATGRWKRPRTTEIDLAWFGVTGAGATTDASRLQAAVNALPTGGTISIGPGIVRLTSTVTVRRVPVIFAGAGASDELGVGTQLLLATGAADGFVLSGAHGGGFRDLQLQGENLTGGAMIRTQREGELGNYLLSFSDCRFRDGYNGIILRSCNTVRFRNCVWNGFSGQQVILLNAVDQISRADPVEFVQCAISAGTGHETVDNLVIDGQGGSIKFIACAILFGRHGIWMRNTTGVNPGQPKFLYFEGGGFENGHGVPVLLEAGAQAQFVNTYISADNDEDAVRVTAGFTGSAIFANSLIRGCGRHGLDIASTRITVTGCLIGNNGRNAHPSFGRQVSGVASSAAGVRVTTATPHGWETDDRVTLQEVGGSTELNNSWGIAVVGPTSFDLLGATLEHPYTSGGVVFRNGSGINLRSTATRVVITGNAIGGLADGTNRQEYGIVNRAADVLVSANDLNGNGAGPYLTAGATDARTRFTGNKGVEQTDGWLSLRIPGAVADGLYDFTDLLYVDGRPIRVTRIARAVSAGSCRVRLETNAIPAGAAPIEVTNQVQTTRLTQPIAIDGTSTPVRLQLRLSNTAAATDLTVQFGYQTIS
ncbi:MAG TPA: ubiquitin-activating E1 FCCH domain-containing protein [Kribbella sp.]|uniref:ubiquitin-activating E1 FCCH domain-containing protein n=1 Tax=Kribbella sp. TaxID=1871183 RepID=UPI002D783734|nr:ubiquitin-activating E1 FCCH domain-containing protein [Kribbella sp.]HET6294155.1 ubiquitin-activating E1 FCCH domain-containing protein [Kribbella sp.]